jgi:hypothetical protein
VHVDSRWSGRVDGFEELLEFDRTVATVKFADDPARLDVQRSEQ